MSLRIVSAAGSRPHSTAPARTHDSSHAPDREPEGSSSAPLAAADSRQVSPRRSENERPARPGGRPDLGVRHRRDQRCGNAGRGPRQTTPAFVRQRARVLRYHHARPGRPTTVSSSGATTRPLSARGGARPGTVLARLQLTPTAELDDQRQWSGAVTVRSLTSPSERARTILAGRWGRVRAGELGARYAASGSLRVGLAGESLSRSWSSLRSARRPSVMRRLTAV
jgi:hypothetical protein